MGCHNETCFICGAPFRNYKDNDAKYDWLKKTFIITSISEILEGTHCTGYGTMTVNGTKYAVSPGYWAFHEGPSAIVIHQDCHKLLAEKLNYHIKYDDVTQINEYSGKRISKMFNYGLITNYQSQVFMIEEATNENPWIILSCLENDKNKKRIISMWTNIINTNGLSSHKTS